MLWTNYLAWLYFDLSIMKVINHFNSACKKIKWLHFKKVYPVHPNYIQSAQIDRVAGIIRNISGGIFPNLPFYEGEKKPVRRLESKICPFWAFLGRSITWLSGVIHSLSLSLSIEPVSQRPVSICPHRGSGGGARQAFHTYLPNNNWHVSWCAVSDLISVCRCVQSIPKSVRKGIDSLLGEGGVDGCLVYLGGEGHWCRLVGRIVIL